MKISHTPLLLTLTAATLLNVACLTTAYADDSYTSDAAISQRVRLALQRQAGLDASKVEVKTVGGAVYLNGELKSHKDLIVALNVVNRVDGIQTVYNYLGALPDPVQAPAVQVAASTDRPVAAQQVAIATIPSTAAAPRRLDR